MNVRDAVISGLRLALLFLFVFFLNHPALNLRAQSFRGLFVSNNEHFWAANDGSDFSRLNGRGLASVHWCLMRPDGEGGAGKGLTSTVDALTTLAEGFSVAVPSRQRRYSASVVARLMKGFPGSSSPAIFRH